MLISYPWDTEALGLALIGVASGVGTACVVCGVWEHEDPLTTTAFFAPAVSIVPHHLSRSKLWLLQGPGDMSQLPLFLQSFGLWNPCRQCHSRSLFMESDLLQLLLPWRKKQGGVRISPCNLEMLTPVPVSSSVWSLQLWQSSSEVCIAVLVTVSQCLCVWANLVRTHLGQSNVLSFPLVHFLSQAPEGESQPMTEVDLFISTQRIKVLNADTQVLTGSHLPRGWSLAWQLGGCALVCRAAVPRCWLPHKLEGCVCSACCRAGGWGMGRDLVGRTGALKDQRKK